MADDTTPPMIREDRLARRLARLFRAERNGRLARRPGVVVRRLLDRRRALVDELLRLDPRRRAPGPAGDRLDEAMAALAREVDLAGQHCHERLAELGAELDRRRRRGAASGLRGDAGGRLLGQG